MHLLWITCYLLDKQTFSRCSFYHIFFSRHIWLCQNIGEHPAAMQRGCANNNISLSILLYASSLSLLIQLLQRIVSTSITLNVVSSYRQHRHHIASIGDCMHLIGFKAAFDSSTDTNSPNIESTNKKILRCV